MNREQLEEMVRDGWHSVTELLGAGPLHRRRLRNLDVRIAVSGVRGKSTTTRWLHDILYARGLDVLAKTTGTDPTAIYNGEEWEIKRSGQVTLYENERLIREVDPEDAIVVENQGIREYTTRLVNQRYVDPQVVFIANVRADHLDTLGKNRRDITRALARAIPPGTHVINGEQNETLRTYMEAELDRRDATITHVRIPEEHSHYPGAECVYGLDNVLRAVGQSPLSERDRESLLESMAPAWQHLPEGRVYNAADANDIQSTETLRQRLAGTTPIQPVLYLRGDRRGRTVSFCHYLNFLTAQELIPKARVVGDNTALFRRRAQCPLIEHDEHSEEPTDVLEDALADGHPVVLMGNTNAEFMQGLSDAIDKRARIPERPM